MVSVSGKPIALKSVHVEGRLDDALASMAVTQRYRNDSGKNLEIVYTFPLASGAVLLGMTATVGSKCLKAVVLVRNEARENYENALAGGDTPILAEQSAPGLYTANLGNIESGEDVTVEFRYVQLPHCEQGSLRLAIPCAIAPRHGDQHREGGLAPHENTAADTLAEYPLTLRLLLCGNLAGAIVECPSHACRMASTADGTVVTLSPGARLDRDFILTISGLKQRAFTLAGADTNGHHLVLAGFHPALPQVEAKPLHLKILADCSGSMAGDNIGKLKEGLFGLLETLKCEDYVSYSRFGSTVRHESEGLLPYSAETAERLAKAFDRAETDLGATELERALLASLNDISPPCDSHEAPCVLLITGGHVWQMEHAVRAVRTSARASARITGQRIFIIGVGSAPADSPLRRLASETGGGCAFVSPNEDMTCTVRSMMNRMREPSASPLQIDWGRDPIWQSALPLNVHDGDPVYAFASFTGPPPDSIPALRWCSGKKGYQVRAEKPAMGCDEAILRLGGAARLATAGSPGEARDLALRYQLVSGCTALLLIHEREGKKEDTLPILHQVPQMLAAGHGGFGTVPRALKSKARSAGSWQETL